MAPVMSAGENVYEDIGPESQIVRNLIRTESQVSSGPVLVLNMT